MKQPLYQQIIDYLQNEIDSGRLPVGAQVPTEKELSAQFNVSRITSKRALTELETQGVIQRHQGKGSFVQAPKHPLHTSLNKVLFLLPFADDLSVGNFYSGLAPTIQAAGLEVFMTSPNFLREKNAADIVNEFAGLVYYAATSNDYLDLLFELALMNFPVVVLDKKIHDLPFVTIQSDNFAGGKTATERLIGLGHTKIGYILSGSPALQSVRQRYLGYLQALKEANLAFHTAITETNLLDEHNFKQYFEAHQLTAVVCDNDFSALHCLRNCKNLGIHVPEELSIIGFDDIQAAAFVEPPLTTMAQDFKEMGKLAGEVLLQTMQQDIQIIEDIQVPVTLIERETISTVSR